MSACRAEAPAPVLEGHAGILPVVSSGAPTFPESSITSHRREIEIIDISGEDATSYLQGQISADVDALAPGDAAWSMILQPTGRLDAWFRLVRTDDGFRCLIEGGGGAAMLARLERFKLRTKVDFELRTVATRSLRGPSPDVWADLDGAIDVGFENDHGAELLADIDGRLPDVGSLDVTEIDSAAFEAARIRAGRPRMGAELDDRTIPAEVGIVDASASFTKGCYTGQELVARMDSRGAEPPRSLRLVTFADAAPPPAAGTPLVVDGAEVGAVTSASVDDAGVVALALVKRSASGRTAAEIDGVEVSLQPLR